MKRKGFTLIELLVVIAIIALLMSILMPALARVRELAQRVVCGSNASGIVKSMVVYSSDDETGRFPRAGGPRGVLAAAIGGAPDAPTEDLAFDIQRDAWGAITTPGRATITSSLYLLIRQAYTTPKQFICRSDTQTSEFKTGIPERLWEFGSPGEQCSYAYHMPYTFPLGGAEVSRIMTGASDSGMGVVADRNPHLDATAQTIITSPDTVEFNPMEAAGRQARQLWNNEAHQKDGQNVAYVDTHVKFEPFSFCGVNDDNIYTMADPSVQWPELMGTRLTIRVGEYPGRDVAWPSAVGPFTKYDSFLISQPSGGGDDHW
jgi:prepilin-type N-terminal cleavage/methylation domain-containing protein